MTDAFTKRADTNRTARRCCRRAKYATARGTARQFLESRLHSKEAAIEAAIALLEWMESEAGEAQADLRDVALIASRKPEPVAS